MEFLECAGMEEVCWNDSEHKYKDKRGGVSDEEFRGKWNVWNALE